MEYRGHDTGTAQCIGRSTLDAALIADDIAREAAWWVAARSGLYAHPVTVWVDRAWEDQQDREELIPPLYWVEGPCDHREQG